jgi:hypothetical protein
MKSLNFQEVRVIQIFFIQSISSTILLKGNNVPRVVCLWVIN